MRRMGGRAPAAEQDGKENKERSERKRDRGKTWRTEEYEARKELRERRNSAERRRKRVTGESATGQGRKDRVKKLTLKGRRKRAGGN